MKHLYNQVLKCQYVLKQYSLFKKFCKFTYNFIFCIFSSNTLQELMFVCLIVSEIRFYGCCHPCLCCTLLLSTLYLKQIAVSNLFTIFGNMNWGQLNFSCRLCTHFPRCFLILSQYLLLAKKLQTSKKYNLNVQTLYTLYNIQSKFKFFKFWFFLSLKLS